MAARLALVAARLALVAARVALVAARLALVAVRLALVDARVGRPMRGGPGPYGDLLTPARPRDHNRGFR